MKFVNAACFWMLLLFVILSCRDDKKNASGLLSGEYWKEQALTNIIPYWTKFSMDNKSGTFFTTLDSLWQPLGDQNKYPSMISRHLFSYSVSYLLSGNPDYVAIADSTVKWLIDKAWDKQYGGWFDAIDVNGNPVLTTKNTFVQVYTITGLVMYYFVTHDSSVLQYIEKSNELLEQKVWDKSAGGYYNTMNRDWSVLDSNKDFASQVTPVSGYLFYLYQSTKDKKYLDQAERILDTTMKNMVDKESGWILESFDSKWKHLAGRSDEGEINVGHNIEVAWMMLRCYLLTGNQGHLQAAKKIIAKIEASSVFNHHNIWLTTTSRTSFKHGLNSYWWVQAYGNMYSQYLHHIFKKDQYIDDFQHGARFWDTEFLDKKHGDTYFSVDSTGKSKDGHKADRYKTSYHSIEQCLINYICLNSWVNNIPVEFHFRINSSNAGDILYPVLLEDSDVKIRKVVVKNKAPNPVIFYDQTIRLEEFKNTELIVKLINPN